MFTIITDIRILQCSANTDHITFINEQIQLRYHAVFIGSSGITFFLPSNLTNYYYYYYYYYYLNCFSCTNFINEILDSWIMVVVISVVVPWSDDSYFILVFKFFTNSIIRATIQTIFDQVKHDFAQLTKILFAHLSDSHAHSFLALDLLDGLMESWC